jgi:hypothetical protein
MTALNGLCGINHNMSGHNKPARRLPDLCNLRFNYSSRAFLGLAGKFQVSHIKYLKLTVYFMHRAADHDFQHPDPPA